MHKNNAHLCQGKAAQVIEVQIRYYSHFVTVFRRILFNLRAANQKTQKSQYFASNANLQRQSAEFCRFLCAHVDCVCQSPLRKFIKTASANQGRSTIRFAQSGTSVASRETGGLYYPGSRVGKVGRNMAILA